MLDFLLKFFSYPDILYSVFIIGIFYKAEVERLPLFECSPAICPLFTDAVSHLVGLYDDAFMTQLLPCQVSWT